MDTTERTQERHRNDQEVVRRLLTTPARWAVVGLSSNRSRTAYGIASYLQQLGMTIVPVHPKAETVHGEAGYPTLSAVPGPIDVVDCFVNSSLVGAVVDEAVAAGGPAGGGAPRGGRGGPGAPPEDARRGGGLGTPPPPHAPPPRAGGGGAGGPGAAGGRAAGGGVARAPAPAIEAPRRGMG